MFKKNQSIGFMSNTHNQMSSIHPFINSRNQRFNDVPYFLNMKKASTKAMLIS